MEVRDVVHGGIQVEPHEQPIIESVYFQRLRQIKQTGFAEFSYPGATHTRFIHSLGAMATATECFDSIFKAFKGKNKDAWRRFRALTRFAALLHDVGHGPLSHTTEFAMPAVDQLNIPNFKKQNRKATHEDYTLKILLDSPLTALLDRAGRSFGFGAQEVARLIEPAVHFDSDFFIASIEGEKIDFEPILHQLISSEMDSDRMDYLRRDSFYAGVSYGQFDYPWIVSNLCVHLTQSSRYPHQEARLALKHRAIYAFEDFLLSRYHMFLQVYLHHKTVIYDEMLARYLSDPNCDYKLPARLEDYLFCTDAHLHGHLNQSKNKWALRIAQKKPYRLLMETHSGIPATATAKQQQEELFQNLEESLNQKKIDFISIRSTGELSKYFGKKDNEIFVRYDNLYTEPTFIPLQNCTTLFTQYPAQRSFSRIYVSPEDFDRIKTQGRAPALNF